MGYARHVGRVGALAVALGVGMAVATNGGVAVADPTGGSSSSPVGNAPSTSDPSSESTSSSPSSQTPSANDSGKGDQDGQGGQDEPAKGTVTSSPTVTGSIGTAETDLTETDATETDATETDATETEANSEPPVVEELEEVEESTAPVETTEIKNDSPPSNDASGLQRVANRVASVPAPDVDNADVVDETDAQPEALSIAADTASSQVSGDVFTTVATALKSVAPAPANAQQAPPTLIGVVTQFVSAVLSPLLGPLTDGPIQIPFLTAALSLLRNEFEKFLNPNQNVAPQQSVSLVNSVPPLPLEDQHVLVIGIDGTNLSRILALPDAQKTNFLELLGTSTSAAPSIVGHTTISNPSWSSILTGAWGERTGVINNVFTPWTYNRFATMFDQIEALNEDIDTTVIANWNVINAISAAGAGGADNNLYVTQIAGDTNWLATDDLVAQLTKDAIEDQSFDPSVLFSYFVGVDENGHLYGGASPEYEAALVNMDENLGIMMDAVTAREALTGEDWTIIVVTDHGHQPQKGFGHGFNSPDETATFVIVDGPGFADNNLNTAYQIVDTTPTVLQIFGGGVQPRTDGVPLQSLGAGDHYANIDDLVAALNAEIAQIESPNFITDSLLTVRTIFSSIPYFIYDFGLTGNSGLPSFLALPAQLLFSGLYVATNIPAQIVAFGTGVYGARLFPILPPPAPDFTPVNPQPTPLAPVLIAV